MVYNLAVSYNVTEVRYIRFYTLFILVSYYFVYAVAEVVTHVHPHLNTHTSAALYALYLTPPVLERRFIFII